jgi:hypothetical protein
MLTELDVEGEFSLLAVHPIISIWAGVKLKTWEIEVHSEEAPGSMTFKKAMFRKDSAPCFMEWHPSKRLLAACWENGNANYAIFSATVYLK